jgi:hypothetical protein
MGLPQPYPKMRAYILADARAGPANTEAHPDGYPGPYLGWARTFARTAHECQHMGTGIPSEARRHVAPARTLALDRFCYPADAKANTEEMRTPTRGMAPTDGG